MSKKSFALLALSFALVACAGDNDGPAPGYYGGGVITNPPVNSRGGACGVSVANDYNQLASACNQRSRGCVPMARGFLQRYPGVDCTIESQGTLYRINQAFIEQTLENMGYHRGSRRQPRGPQPPYDYPGQPGGGPVGPGHGPAEPYDDYLQ